MEARGAPSGRSRGQPLAREGDERLRRVGERAAARPHEGDLTRGFESIHLRGRQRAGGELGLDGRAGDEADAVTGSDRALDRLLEAQLEADVEVAQARPGLPELVLDHLADPRSLLHDDQRLVAQLLQGERPSGEPVSGRADEDHFIAKEGFEHDRSMGTRRPHDAELELALGDELDDALRVEDRQGDLDAGVAEVELAEEQRYDAASGAGRGADPDRAGELAVGLGDDLVDELLLESEQPLCAPVQAPPGLRWLNATPGAVEELPAETLLERADLLADSRLREPELLGGAREALALDHRAKGRELPRVHKEVLSIR